MLFKKLIDCHDFLFPHIRPGQVLDEARLSKTNQRSLCLCQGQRSCSRWSAGETDFLGDFFIGQDG